MTTQSSINQPATPIQLSRQSYIESQMTLQPFDSNYTLPGIIRHIELQLSQVITHKKQSLRAEQASTLLQIKRLNKIQENVSILKASIFHYFGDIMKNQGSKMQEVKTQRRTNPTNTQGTPESAKKFYHSMTINGFQLENPAQIEDQIQHVTVKRSNFSEEAPKKSILKEQPRQKIEEISFQDRLRKNNQRMISHFSLVGYENNIKIEDESTDQLDLVCYEDQEFQQEAGYHNKQTKGLTFEPIEERPIEEQSSIEKTCNFNSTVNKCSNETNINITFGEGNQKKLEWKSNQIKSRPSRRFQYLKYLNVN